MVQLAGLLVWPSAAFSLAVKCCQLREATTANSVRRYGFWKPVEMKVASQELTTNRRRSLGARQTGLCQALQEDRTTSNGGTMIDSISAYKSEHSGRTANTVQPVCN